MFFSKLAAGCIAAAISAAAISSDTNQAVSDEAPRLAALRTVFPRMQVSIDQGKRIDNSGPGWPDALAREAVYRVVGKATNEAERFASEDLPTDRFSETRQVRFQLFRWPTEDDAGFLVALQYDFLDVKPALGCPSIGLLVHVVKNAAGWTVHDKYLLETGHHSSLQRVELSDLTGHDANELVIESNFGGAGTAGSTLQVFDLSHGRFDEVFSTDSRLQAFDEDWYTQVLDLRRTRENHSQRLCSLKTTLFENGKAFKPPRVSHPCFNRGLSIDDAQYAADRNRMLAPLR